MSKKTTICVKKHFALGGRVSPETAVRKACLFDLILPTRNVMWAFVCVCECVLGGGGLIRHIGYKQVECTFIYTALQFMHINK